MKFYDEKRNSVVEVNNPDLGIMTERYSHRSEIFGILEALIFLDEYCRCYLLKQESPIQYHCDNLEVFKKVKDIQREKYHYDKAYRTTYHDAELGIKELISSKMKIHHVKSYTDKRKKEE